MVTTHPKLQALENAVLEHFGLPLSTSEAKANDPGAARKGIDSHDSGVLHESIEDNVRSDPAQDLEQTEVNPVAPEDGLSDDGILPGRIIIFSSLRESVASILSLLSKHEPKISARYMHLTLNVRLPTVCLNYLCSVSGTNAVDWLHVVMICIILTP